ncbi:AAA family ATPase [Saccharothrix xinjiangensis]|uniref:AAA family ATPase n=1 Tax=Saccharothrix xinjiangensis TaxID=204798 RepID=A0ABV9Y664_9PSEU
MDGTHAAGKTTLIHALTAHYRRQGVNVVAMGEPARTSPFMEEIVLYDRSGFDLAAEVDVFAAHLGLQLRTARNHTLLIADKTIVNVLAYARLLLVDPDERSTAVLEAMEMFCLAWAHTYDMIVFTQDRYTQPGDAFRAKVTDLQNDADAILRQTYTRLGVPLVELPGGLDTDERVRWVVDQAARHGVFPTG